MDDNPTGGTPANKSPLIFLAAGIVAVILAILGIIAVSRQNKIPQPAHTIHTESIVTPTIIPLKTQSLDDKLKSLEDDAVVIDQSLKQQ